MYFNVRQSLCALFADKNMFVGFCFDIVIGLSTCLLVDMFNMYCLSNIWTFDVWQISNMFLLGLGSSVLVVILGAVLQSIVFSVSS